MKRREESIGERPSHIDEKLLDWLARIGGDLFHRHFDSGSRATVDSTNLNSFVKELASRLFDPFSKDPKLSTYFGHRETISSKVIMRAI